jgi:hypothetical protein
MATNPAIAVSLLKHTLLLDTVAWDLVLDVYGNIAVATDPYSLAQDAASAIRLFQGELWYDTSQGVPYFLNILGRTPPLSLLRTRFEDAARTVPGVVSAKCVIAAVQGRMVTGQVQITDTNGRTATAGF